jgi:hypothetical protein
MQAQLSSNGTLAQMPGTLSAVARGVDAGGDVRSSVVVTGDNNSVTYIIRRYLKTEAHPEATQISRFTATVADLESLNKTIDFLCKLLGVTFPPIEIGGNARLDLLRFSALPLTTEHVTIDV